MKKFKFSSFMMFLSLVILLTGCFGSDSKGNGPNVPASYVTLKGAVVAPDQVESSLLASVLNNTDNGSRDAFKKAAVYVNGNPAASYTIDSAIGTSWPLRIYNVPEQSTRKYNIQIIAGKITLKSNIYISENENFTVNMETTAAALLAEAFNKDQQQILASYPAVVNSLKGDLINAALKTATELGSNLVTVGKDAIDKTYKTYINAINNVNSNAKIAYLQKENDLDGDGAVDLQIVQIAGGQRVRFFTALATATSLLENTPDIGSYTDAKLLQDFAGQITSENNTFSAADKDFSLGLFFKRSAAADQYVKVLVRRIDLDIEGKFSGVVAEYGFISTDTTAITKGSKILQLQNGVPVEGAVQATDFVKDGFATDNNLTYISAALGIGCLSGNQMLVALIDGQPELDKLSTARKFSSGEYVANTTNALKELGAGRTLAIGDVFSAYFPTTKNYAIFKIKAIDSSTVTLDYKVNSTPNEPRF